MGLKFTIKEDFTEKMAEALVNASERAENIVANEAEKDTSPFVPFLNGILDESTHVKGRYIIYPGPYAHYLYYGKVWVDPKTHAAGFLTKDGWKSRYGVKKIESDRELDIKKRSGHEKAQSHWFEASKAQNIDKWEQLAAKVVNRELGK